MRRGKPASCWLSPRKGEDAGLHPIDWGLGLGAGILQGVVEWLPVSSKTLVTLLLAGAGLPLGQAYALGLVANFGSFFAAVFYFRRDLGTAIGALRRPLGPGEGPALLRYLVLATLMTGVVGLPLYVGMRRTFSVVGGSAGMLIVGLLLLVTAALARHRERRLHQAGAPALRRDPRGWESLLTGACQGLAALPGISRSGVTVTPLLGLGFDAAAALRLSFLLDVPALLGAGVVPMVLGHGGVRAVRDLGVGTTLVMLVTAAVVSFLAIGAVLGWARRLRTSSVTVIIAVVAIATALAGLLFG